jgi:hypothetical protein
MALEAVLTSGSSQVVVGGLLVAATSASQSSSSSCRNIAAVWNPLSASSLRRVQQRSRRCQFLGSKLSSGLQSSSRRGEPAKDFLRYCCRVRSAGGDDDGGREKASLTAVQEEEEEKEQEENFLGTWVKAMTRTVAEAVVESGKAWQKPAMVAMMMGLLLTQSPDMANAAGGGRVGGKVGGGFSAPRSSRTYSAPSSGYSIPRGYSAPVPGFSYSVPYAVPSPFFGPALGGGLYVGPAYGIGLGGGSIFFLMLLGFIIWQAIYGFLSEREGGGSLLSGIQKYSVLKLQVRAGFSFSSSNSLLLFADESVVSQGLIVQAVAQD